MVEKTSAPNRYAHRRAYRPQARVGRPADAGTELKLERENMGEKLRAPMVRPLPKRLLRSPAGRAIGNKLLPYTQQDGGGDVVASGRAIGAHSKWP